MAMMEVENYYEDVHQNWGHRIPVAEKEWASRIPVEEVYYYDWGNQLPVGFRFLPTAEELVKQYLIQKVLGNPLPVLDFLEVEEAEFYTTPPMTSVHFCSGERERYFFIRKDKNFPNNPIRKVGNHSGSWILRKTRRIFDTIGNKIALKFYFGYYSKLGRTRWKMDEFQLPNEFYKNFKVKDEWAVGRLIGGKACF